MPPVVQVPGVGTFPRRAFLIGLLVCGYRLVVPVIVPAIIPVTLPLLIPLMSPVTHAAVIPVTTEPRGPGVAAPLEGGISCAAAMAALSASWAYDYQSVTTGVSMIRSGDYTPESAEGQVSGAWWERVLYHIEHPDSWVLILNEPNSASQDNLSAVDAARMLREDWVERILVEDPARRLAQPARVLPVNWVGLNLMIGLESSRRWVIDYKAAGGIEPPLHGAHAYSVGGSGLRALALEWRAFLATLGWHNPLVLTECGPRPIPAGTPPANPDQVADVLREAFALWREGVIAGFAWFSAVYPGDGGQWAAGDLLTAEGGLTPLGKVYRELATGGSPPGPFVKPVIDEHLWFPVARK